MVKDVSDVSAVAAGTTHTVILKTDGSVHTAGRNHLGELGRGDEKGSRYTFEQAYPSEVKAVAAGSDTLILKKDGSVHRVGGQYCGSSCRPIFNDEWQLVYASDVSAIEAGDGKYMIGAGRNMILTNDGSVHTRSEDGNITSFHPGHQKVVAMSIWHHSVILKADGSVHTAGLNVFGQLGDGTTKERTDFKPIRV